MLQRKPGDFSFSSEPTLFPPLFNQNLAGRLWLGQILPKYRVQLEAPVRFPKSLDFLNISKQDVSRSIVLTFY
jgi:hypothetical protein